MSPSIQAQRTGSADFRTGTRIESILREYLSRLERYSASPSETSHDESVVKPLNLIVITDGAPSDDPESVIIAAAKRVSRQHQARQGPH